MKESRLVKGLDEVFIDPDVADQVLNLSLGDKTVSFDTILSKSFYEFDLQSEQGITSFLSMLPFLDEEVVKQAAQSVWSDYNMDSFDLKRCRFELLGYFLDYLNEGIE